MPSSIQPSGYGVRLIWQYGCDDSHKALCLRTGNMPFGHWRVQGPRG